MAEKKKTAATPIYETQESLYDKAIKRMDADELIVQFAFKIENYLRAAAMFDEVGDYLDAPEKAKKCRELAERAREDEKQAKYQKALIKKEECRIVGDYEKLSEQFAQLGDYADAEKQSAECIDKIAEIHKKNRKKRNLAAVILAALAVLLLTGWKTGFYRYVKGSAYELLGKYDDAEKIFKSLNGFLDSEDKAERCIRQIEEEKQEKNRKALINAKEGKEFTYGTHTWKVLKRNGDLVYMIATNIDANSEFRGVAFHETQEAVNWENSSLREWLNTEILENCFSEEERARLVPMSRPVSDNEEYGTRGGAPVEDYVSILSVEEAEKYMDILKTLGLDYWLRTPGHASDTYAYITAEHTVMSYGYPVSTNKIAVRPVITVDCSDMKEEAGA